MGQGEFMQTVIGSPLHPQDRAIVDLEGWADKYLEKGKIPLNWVQDRSIVELPVRVTYYASRGGYNGIVLRRPHDLRRGVFEEPDAGLRRVLGIRDGRPSDQRSECRYVEELFFPGLIGMFSSERSGGSLDFAIERGVIAGDMLEQSFFVKALLGDKGATALWALAECYGIQVCLFREERRDVLSSGLHGVVSTGCTVRYGRWNMGNKGHYGFVISAEREKAL